MIKKFKANYLQLSSEFLKNLMAILA